MRSVGARRDKATRGSNGQSNVRTRRQLCRRPQSSRASSIRAEMNQPSRAETDERPSLVAGCIESLRNVVGRSGRKQDASR